ncbi:FAD/NAD(P)-binding protein, partial [bacterium]|nr:FAD/NAD(P)-binding protein [bacterium]
MPQRYLIDPAQAQDLYLPLMAELVSVKALTPQETLYEIALPGGRDLGHRPGQFVKVSLFGVGEAPFSVSSSPTKRGSFELGIRTVGMLTEVMQRMGPGEKVGIRGPFGNGFDTGALRGKDLLIIAGGIGLVPLRSLINFVIDNRDDFGRLIICYGNRSDAELLFAEERAAWERDPSIEYHVTVDRGSSQWRGRTGVITTLLPGLKLDVDRTAACICGPPVMFRYVLLALRAKGMPEKGIFLSLERRMKCGVGKC